MLGNINLENVEKYTSINLTRILHFKNKHKDKYIKGKPF